MTPTTSRLTLIASPAVVPVAAAAIAKGCEPARILAGLGLDLLAVRYRVELVAEALDLPASEVEQAMSDPEDQSLVDFAHRYGQDLHWLLIGDLTGTLRGNWRRHGVDPDVRLPT